MSWLRYAGNLVASLYCLLAAGAYAQEEPPERWRVDHGEVNCTMSRTIRASQTTLLIRNVPGTDLAKLLLSSRSWTDSPLRAGEQVSVQIGDSAPVEVQAGAMRLESGTFAVGFQEIPLDYLDRLAAGGEIRIRRSGEVIITVTFPASVNAVAAMRSCIDQRLTAWGVDPQARARLRQPAAPIRGRPSGIVNPVNMAFMGDDDAIIVRANIDERGRLSRCLVVRSIGRPMVERGICSSVIERLRYRPAIGADGQPAASMIIDVIVVSN
jgi:hypothetical protein